MVENSQSISGGIRIESDYYKYVTFITKLGIALFPFSLHPSLIKFNGLKKFGKK